MGKAEVVTELKLTEDQHRKDEEDKQYNDYHTAHLVHEHPRNSVIIIHVDAVPTVDVCIRGPTTIGTVAVLQRIEDVIIRSRQGMTELGLDYSCDSVTDSVVRRPIQWYTDSHLDDTRSHFIGIAYTWHDSQLVPGTFFQSTLEINLISPRSKHLVTMIEQR